MLNLITLLAPILSDALKKAIPDQDKHAQIDSEVKLALLNHVGSLEGARAEIIKEEAKSEHWITATWRPILMLVIIGIVALNYLIFPVLSLITGVPLALELPSELWNLLTIGVGGYIVGRSGEKMVATYKGD